MDHNENGKLIEDARLLMEDYERHAAEVDEADRMLDEMEKNNNGMVMVHNRDAGEYFDELIRKGRRKVIQRLKREGHGDDKNGYFYVAP